MHQEWVCKADWTGMWNTLVVSGLLAVFLVTALMKNLPRIRGWVKREG
ncbi:hypothetical protein [Burkholderia sp. LMG 13014]|nr:hypothetical protein [Burkholderia sp. LMG 13014]